MLKHYAWPAWDEGYEYIGMHDDASPPGGAIECTEPTDLTKTGYIRFNASTQVWYWPFETGVNAMSAYGATSNGTRLMSA